MKKLTFVAALLLAGCNTSADQLETETPTNAPDLGAIFNPLPESEVALRFHGFRESFEIAPILLAADQFFEPGISLKRGGIPNLVGAPPLPIYGDEGWADIASHAETQLLRYSVENPNIRAIMTVTEGDYGIIARRSSGIANLSDLRGKKIATLPYTSAGYFLGLMLAKEGMTLDDVVIVDDLRLPLMGEAIANGDVDALAIWEPESEEGALALGDDLISFSGEGIYREIFNLNTTAENLAEPEMRATIKQFLKAVISAREAMNADPARAQQLVGQMSEHSAEQIAASWPHHTYLAGKVDDIVDVLVAEEIWLAGNNDRPARGRTELENLVDYSLYDEAMAEWLAEKGE